MDSKRERSQDQRGMLAVEGQVCVLDGFVELLENVVKSSVSEAINDELARLAHSKADEEKPGPAGGARRGLELTDEEQDRARLALASRELGPKRKEGQGMINARTLARFLDVSDRLLYRLIAEHAIPEPVVVGRRTKRWPVEEVMAWVFNGCAPGEKWRRVRMSAIREYRSVVDNRVR